MGYSNRDEGSDFYKNLIICAFLACLGIILRMVFKERVYELGLYADTFMLTAFILCVVCGFLISTVCSAWNIEKFLMVVACLAVGYFYLERYLLATLIIGKLADLKYWGVFLMSMVNIFVTVFAAALALAIVHGIISLIRDWIATRS